MLKLHEFGRHDRLDYNRVYVYYYYYTTVPYHIQTHCIVLKMDPMQTVSPLHHQRLTFKYIPTECGKQVLYSNGNYNGIL